MKKKLIYLFVLLGAVLVGVGTKAQAQIVGVMDANIPFQFRAGGANLPAGKYIIKVLDTSNVNILEIESVDRGTAALFDTEDARADRMPQKSELIFDHVGDRYFLTRIFDADDEYGAEVVNPRRSRKHRVTMEASNQEHVPAFHHSNKGL